MLILNTNPPLFDEPEMDLTNDEVLETVTYESISSVIRQWDEPISKETTHQPYNVAFEDWELTTNVPTMDEMPQNSNHCVKHETYMVIVQTNMNQTILYHILLA